MLNKETDYVAKEVSSFKAYKKILVRQFFEDNVSNDHHDVWICFILDCLHQIGELKYVKKLQH